jgi:hypothetical protein
MCGTAIASVQRMLVCPRCARLCRRLAGSHRQLDVAELAAASSLATSPAWSVAARSSRAARPLPMNPPGNADLTGAHLSNAHLNSADLAGAH